MLFLCSGLPMHTATSFSHQLGLLKAAFERCGRNVELLGPAIAPDKDSEGAILLGYPDQFPWLSSFLEKKAGYSRPVYLWAQFSKPPSLPNAVARSVIFCPLTPKTGEFLARAGVSRIGPVIPHGVDLSIFKPTPSDCCSSKPAGRGVFTVGCLGAHTLRKRFKTIFESFSLFCGQFPAGRLIVKTDAIVSKDGEDLSYLARQFGIDGKVTFITEVLSPDELASLYRNMDVFLSLSEWEGFCIPVIEAMACGIPVIAQDTQGPGELLPYRDLLLTRGGCIHEDGVTLVHADPGECAEKFALAETDKSLMKECSRKGISAVKNCFDIDVVAKTWLSLLQKR